MTDAVKQPDFIFKTILLGDSGVGKSNICLRFAKNEFCESTLTTVGVEFIVKDMVVDNKRITIQVWDTAGQDRYRALTPAYFRKSVGALLVYDISNRESFLHLEDWLELVREFAQPDQFQILIVGNKCDLDDLRQVSKEEAAAFCQKYNLPLIETSAKDNTNVELAFEILIKDIVKQLSKKDLPDTEDGDSLLMPNPQQPFTVVKPSQAVPPNGDENDRNCWC